jgi:cystathionine gamma-lyase
MGSTENSPTTERRFGTLAVHAGSPHDPVTGAVIAPVSPSTQEIQNLN